MTVSARRALSTRTLKAQLGFAYSRNTLSMKSFAKRSLPNMRAAVPVAIAPEEKFSASSGRYPHVSRRVRGLPHPRRPQSPLNWQDDFTQDNRRKGREHMSRRTPLLAVKEATAAQMLDMRTNEFRNLVQIGALPQPIDLAGQVLRWRVSDLEAILTGAVPDEGFET